MSASSSLFLVVALAFLVISANTLKCWFGNDRSGKIEQQCEPGTVFCAKTNCMRKYDKMRGIGYGCQANSSICDLGYIDNPLVKCENFQCCRGNLCNGVPDRVFHGRPYWNSGVIGLRTPLGICSIVFAVLIAAILSAEFVNWF
ncbi:hypothetical protein niasHS_009780 [Heterodera schachtii]|uniref:Uncharacterized protein n=1 Tax=Heterodera schachtii TaxID=97005 RepID=A0ABD2IWJ0_HETSC